MGQALLRVLRDTCPDAPSLSALPKILTPLFPFALRQGHDTGPRILDVLPLADCVSTAVILP